MDTTETETWPTADTLEQYKRQRQRSRDEQIARLREFADLLENNPDLDTDYSFNSFAIDSPYLPDQWQHEETHSKVIAEFRLAWLKRQMQVLVGLGFDVEKTSSDYDYGFRATNPETDAVVWARVSNQDICEMVETGEVEEVKVVEIPDSVKEVYTRIETKPVTKSVCPPILSASEIEAVLGG